jgi:photosystem II stability/assembly factor-like uncharacterized protein
VRFGSATLGVLAGDGGTLAVTNDGGAHWNAASSGTGVTLRGATVAAGAGVLVVVGDQGTMLRSADGGSTWQRVFGLGTANLHGVASDTTASLVLVVDDTGGLWMSADGARTFASEGNAGMRLDAVAMSDDASHAVAVGSLGAVLERAGPGAWLTKDSGTTSDLHAALITDGGSRQYIGGEGGTLLTSVDNGASWSLVPLKVGVPIYGLEDL